MRRSARLFLLSLMLPALLLPAIAFADGAPPPALPAGTDRVIAREKAQLLREPDVTRVGFYEMIVTRAGEIVSVSVLLSSGEPALDQRVLDMLKGGHVKRLPKNSPPLVALVLPVAFRKHGEIAGAKKPDGPAPP